MRLNPLYSVAKMMQKNFSPRTGVDPISASARGLASYAKNNLKITRNNVKNNASVTRPRGLGGTTDSGHVFGKARVRVLRPPPDCFPLR